MIFTGKNLKMVRRGLVHALGDIQNEIATCPDIFEFEGELEDLEAEKEEFERLLARIDKAIAKEKEK